MAERRMFHAGVVESDSFLDMSPAAQALYFHLGMQADDDGFVNGPRQVCRRCGARMEELQELLDGGFLLWFDGIAVVKHFRMANTLQNDRLKQLNYPEIAKKLFLLPTREYTTKSGKRKENLYFLRMAKLKKSGIQMESKRNPPGIQPESQGKGKEQKGREKNRTEPNRIEGNGTEKKGDTVAMESVPEHAGGVAMSVEEIGDLCRIMGLEKAMKYSAKLSKFIEERGANIKDHYDTIIKWWQEDGGTYNG